MKEKLRGRFTPESSAGGWGVRVRRAILARRPPIPREARREVPLIAASSPRRRFAVLSLMAVLGLALFARPVPSQEPVPETTAPVAGAAD